MLRGKTELLAVRMQFDIAASGIKNYTHIMGNHLLLLGDEYMIPQHCSDRCQISHLRDSLGARVGAARTTLFISSFLSIYDFRSTSWVPQAQSWGNQRRRKGLVPRSSARAVWHTSEYWRLGWRAFALRKSNLHPPPFGSCHSFDLSVGY